MPAHADGARTFNLGLVMAGAVSAGAYTAGVIDFLLEALAAWEAAKAAGHRDVPDHNVCLSVAAGASAGGVVSALLGMMPFTGHRPITDLGETDDPVHADDNLLYRSWVRDIDIRGLLATDDVERRSGRVMSLLNGQAIARVAHDAVARVREAIASGAAAPPPYFANPLDVHMCVTNLRGLPYLIRMVADAGVRGHRLISHGDHCHFAVMGAGSGTAGGIPPGAIAVTPEGDDDGWDRLCAAALATSAFPGGLPARDFTNDLSAYAVAPRVRGGSLSGHGRSMIAPDMALASQGPYRFWCVDGGLIDNEPIELVRRSLNARRAPGDAGDSRWATQAILLIDPFPEDCGPCQLPLGDVPDMFDALMALIPVLKEHARFKADELVLALSDEVNDRFLIAPVRANRDLCETELASAGLAGFAGFFHVKFRQHDFQLGRRNCQQFLRDHFTIHRDNPLVRPWVERFRDNPDALARYQPPANGGGTRYHTDLVQIIPLMDQVRTPIPLRAWPRFEDDRVLEGLTQMVEARARVIVPEMIRGLYRRLGMNGDRLRYRLLQLLAERVSTRRLCDAVMATIRSDLERRRLI